MSNTKKQNQHKNQPKQLQEKYSVRNAIVNYYLVLMFSVFPLFATNAYFNIRHDKYYLFLGLSGVMLIAVFLITLYMTFDIENSSDNPPDMTASDYLRYKNFSVTDWAMLAFLAVCFISTMFSSDIEASIFGTEGRNNGLLLMAFYVGVYFAVTRFFYYFEYVFLIFAGVSAVVYLLAVLNSIYIDPLGMFAEFDPVKHASTIENFTSTIGNKNLMSSYICVSLPVFITMSVHAKKLIYRAGYLVASGLGFMSLMSADSDSGILGMGVVAIVLLVWYSKRISNLKRYFLAITVMFASAKVLRFIYFLADDNTKGVDQFQQIFVYSNTGYILILIFAIITAILYFVDYKKPDIVFSNAVPITLGVISVLGFIGIIGIIIYFSCFNTTAELGTWEKLLRFNDSWGTHRGFMWIRSLWIFNDASFFEKLFGVGPDMFSSAFRPYFTDLMKYGDTSTNAAHNEYLNYLITLGLLGLGSYLVAVGSSIVRSVKSACKNPLTIVCISAVICYSAQAVVNISQPITTPLFILFIALNEAIARKCNSNA